jgi:hypothetical protein
MLTESNDQSGTVGLLVGIIVLVFVGIIFSLMADKRFKFSNGKADMEAAITEGRQQLETARRQTEIARDEYEKKAQLVNQPALLEKARRAVSSSGDRIRELRTQLADLKQEVEAEKSAFAEYRATFRKQVRQAAAGEKLDQLEVVGGKVYQGVTIRRVHAEGMEVSHSQGSLRLGPDDLADSWRERFQWGAEELAGAPKPAEKPGEKQLPGHQKPVKQDQPKPGPPEKPGKELASLRRDVSEAKRHLDRSELEVSRVRKDAETSKAKSVPGSSETWNERITRLESGSEVFRAQYKEARGRLAAVAPGDAALSEGSSQ